MNARHTAEFNALPLGFAFSKEQFKRVLEQWNITEEEAEAGAILSIGSGGFIRATDKELYLETVKRIQEEENTAIEADKTGEGFIYQMFLYELRNHEFIITQDTDETLTALGISEESDCIAIIVSEESGKISIAINGMLNYNLSLDDARIFNPGVFSISSRETVVCRE